MIFLAKQWWFTTDKTRIAFFCAAGGCPLADAALRVREGIHPSECKIVTFSKLIDSIGILNQ
jgi:hypothetical protein